MHKLAITNNNMQTERRMPTIYRPVDIRKEDYEQGTRLRFLYFLIEQSKKPPHCVAVCHVTRARTNGTDVDTLPVDGPVREDCSGDMLLDGAAEVDICRA